MHHLNVSIVVNDTTRNTSGKLFLFIIIVVFIMYTNMLFIKRRSYEFGLLQTIGLGKKSIIYMLMLEQLFIFIITALLGMIIGILGSKILLMIVLKLLGIHTSVSIILVFKRLRKHYLYLSLLIYLSLFKRLFI